MSQHDFNIANQGFPGFRSDLNNALEALVSLSSGSSAPSATFAYQIWVDTGVTPALLKIRDGSNTAWITLGSIDSSADTFTAAVERIRAGNGTSSSPSFAFTGDNDTGFYSAGTNEIGVAVNGTAAGKFTSTGFTGNAANVYNTVLVANGGTGATSLTANNVILGNGTSAVQVVAPSTTGNVLTSNGTTWTSAALSAVTSLNGQTGSITNTTLDTIGSVIRTAANTSTVLKPGDTISGSNLYYPTSLTTVGISYLSEGASLTAVPRTGWGSSGIGVLYANKISSGNTGYTVPGGNVSTLSGTWRAMEVVPARYSEYEPEDGFTNSLSWTGLFVRVS